MENSVTNSQRIHSEHLSCRNSRNVKFTFDIVVFFARYSGFSRVFADVESTQSDVDDRCESDISGIAQDDLSSNSIGDLPIAAGDVVRSYTHRPNTDLNRWLTTLALVVLFGAVGIGVGHFFGTCSGARLRRQQIEKMKAVTDDYLMCLQRQDRLEEQLFILEKVCRYYSLDFCFFFLQK